MATNITSTCNASNSIRSNTPTSHQDVSSIFKIGWRSDPLTDRGLISFTLPSLSGTISAVSLFCYMALAEDGGSDTINCNQMTRSWTESSVDWNTYDGSNSWTSAGGDFSGTVIHASTTPSDGVYQQWDLMGGSATNPLTLAFGNTVILMLKRATEAVNTRTYDYNSRGNASNKPYLQITYTGTGNSLTTLNCS